MEKTYKYHFLDFVAYFLMIVCFPINPLILLRVIEPYENKILFWFGACFWLIGMVFVIYPFIYFKIKGGVSKGKAYVHTNKLVRSGLYSIVRHVQYTGGILSIFFATPFLYPHWIFVILGIPGIFLTYLGTKKEDQLMIEKFGDEYRKYMDEVPAMNILLGIIRKIKRNGLAIL
ncbi:MAG: isoprenylcysteine carboxylmethyltransferase family protein [Bacteroidales bacterium]|nr:isoprenylcysteine carboxylmethyltransferase family protein [Bacteroidales bacterium]